ncbi:MAG: dienelactone hydrolase family protein [Acinetobacter sp.]
MTTITQLIEYKYQNQLFESTLVYPTPATSLKGALLMAPNWMGIKHSDVEIAQHVAVQGYVVLLLDLYGKGKRPQNAAQAKTWVEQIKNTEHEVGLVNAAHQALLAQNFYVVDAEKVAAFGFCLGGHNVLEYARSGANIKAAISFHGSLDRSERYDMKNFHGKILVLDGADDPLVPREQLSSFRNEMAQTDIDWQLISFGNTCHSFTEKAANEAGVKQYNALSSKRAFHAMYTLLDEIF